MQCRACTRARHHGRTACSDCCRACSHKSSGSTGLCSTSSMLATSTASLQRRRQEHSGHLQLHQQIVTGLSTRNHHWKPDPYCCIEAQQSHSACCHCTTQGGTMPHHAWALLLSAGTSLAGCCSSAAYAWFALLLPCSPGAAGCHEPPVQQPHQLINSAGCQSSVLGPAWPDTRQSQSLSAVKLLRNAPACAQCNQPHASLLSARGLQCLLEPGALCELSSLT